MPTCPDCTLAPSGRTLRHLRSSDGAGTCSLREASSAAQRPLSAPLSGCRGRCTGDEELTQRVQCPTGLLGERTAQKMTPLFKGLPPREHTVWHSELTRCMASAHSDPLPGLRSRRARERPLSHNTLNHSPEPGSYNLSRREITVDLPAPLGPTSAVTDPDGMERLKSWNMGTSGRAG